MKKPFFSVIIPTYNRAHWLKIAIDSALAQTFKDFELIVVDDGSKDTTSEMIKSYGSQLCYIYQENAGVSGARNRGIKEAQGEFICFLDSDDRFRKNKLKITYDYIKKYPQYHIFHTEEIWYRNNRLLMPKIYHKKPAGHVFKTAVKLCCISPSTVVINKNVFKKIGVFDESFPTCEDYDFFLRATAQFPIYLIPQHLTIKQGGHSDQQSKKYPAMDEFRIEALTKILKTGKLNNSNYQAAAEELKRKCQIYIKGAKKRGKIKDVNYYKNLITVSGRRKAGPYT